MSKAYAVRHVAFEDAGLLEPILARCGLALETVDAWALPNEVAEAPLVVLLGGPISVNDIGNYPFLREEVALARDRLAAGRPTLGICLGAQILCRAIAGTVRPGAAREIGWAPVTLSEAGRSSVLAPLEDTAVLHWHGDECMLPEGVSILASTPACMAQAFIPAPRSLALQFHIEAGSGGLEAWLVGHTGEIAATPPVDIAKLRMDTARNAPLLRPLAEDVFERWLKDVGVAS
jgi:GMP synthase (glutamine-hydrolysing)